MQLPLKTAVAGVALVAAFGVQPVSASSPSPPAYVKTVGFSAHATMYPSGVSVDAAGNVYLADTGNDQVKAYNRSGTLLWNRGVAGSKGPGNFDTPRDVAYLNGKLYVADLGFKRVQVLDASTGAPLSVWTTSFPSVIGISAGVDAGGNPIILVTEDVLNQVRIFTPSGTFIRAVGSGVAGSGPGQLNAPRDAATDSAGNIYVADYANNRIAKFTPTGGWIKAWGTEGGQNGEFRRPYGIDLDVQDNVWVADATNHRIQEFTSDGTYIRQMGTSGSGPGQFSQLRRVAVTPGVVNPDVYGADLWGNKIERFAYSSGSYHEAQIYAGNPAADAGFNEPSGVSVDANNIFVADTVNQRIQRFSATGTWQMHFGHRGWGADLSGLNWPRDVAIEQTDPSKVWVSDTKNGRMLEFTRDGAPTGRTFGTQGTALGQFRRTGGVTPTSDGVVVTDILNNRVQRWRTTGTPTLVWSATGFATPKAVAVANGTVYVADSGHNRIVELSLADGHQIGTIGVGTLHETEAVAVDAAGNIWVADTGANRLVEFASNGTLLQTFGAAGTGNSGFNTPEGLAVFGGKLYVCDTFNDRVQVYTIS